MSASDFVHLDFEVIRQETEKAFQFIFADGSIKWVPKSVCADAGDYQAGDRNGTISIKGWFWEKEAWL